MRKTFLLFLVFISCANFGKLTLVNDLSKLLKEVSGNEMIVNSDLIWMINDSGNKSDVFGVSQSGKIESVVKVNTKNHDWEDLTSDDEGNLYIGDFGNNSGKRKKLHILKISNQDLLNKSNVAVEKITFEYSKLPNEKRKTSYDAEGFFYYKDFFYIFTKSRQKNKLGKTLLFRVPNKVGKHKAEYISAFTFCNDIDCRVTAADISKDGEKVVLLSHNSVIELKGFKNDDFFSGTINEIPLNHISQKEGVCFKDDTTVFITDEYSRYTKGNLYRYELSN